MDDSPSLKRRKLLPSEESEVQNVCQGLTTPGEEDESTDVKLATLASLFPNVENVALLDILVESNGSIHAASQILSSPAEPASRKPPTKGIGYQTSLESFRKAKVGSVALSRPAMKDTLTRKGQTLHLYTPEDIESHTPCSIIHNFLPAELAVDLLRELLQEASTFERQVFKLFDNVVQSPHSACFYVESLEERKRQQTEYLYNGTFLTDIRQITPQMSKVSASVQGAVNGEISRRIKHFYPGGKKLRYQSPKDWFPNAAFVNQYQGGSESVGYHSDQLTYLGPRAVIGSLSLGVARQFRIRKIVARDEQDNQPGARISKDMQRADAEGQIAIHLPHNSLLVMHADMQEEYKHSIHPAPVIDPHPISGNKRINITYRHYRENFHPNCTFFQWAEFDDDGEPQWAKKSDKA
ncbi:MAG: hypothetical protein LQ350_002957 [Teloschistes chrysophthalmus]|nr:MAG: hypothetical protein LQ350_002957 [Niorma chrysophthalma]